MSHFLKRKYVCTKFLTFPKEKIPDQITKCEKLSLGKKVISQLLQLLSIVEKSHVLR